MGQCRRIIIFFLLVFAAGVNGQKKDLTFEALFGEHGFSGKSISEAKWFDNDNKYSYLENDPVSRSKALYQHDVKTGNEELLVTRDDLIAGGALPNCSIKNYEWSPGYNYLLFTNLIHARSNKSGGVFYVYELQTKKIVLTIAGENQMNAAFSPDGRKLGFVRDNNLYYADINSGKVTQLTFDGSELILNGVFDWVYEEEFSIIRGWEWSPDSRQIAFWRLDQSLVPKIKIAKWDSLYLNYFEMHYPKPGAHNALVSIGVVNVEDISASGKPSVTWMNTGDDTDIYIPRIKFTKKPGLLSIQRLNRLQNKLDFIMADTRTGQSEIIFSEISDTWIDIFDDLVFLDDNLFIRTSEKNGYKHIYLYDYSGNEIRQLTSGEWEVEKVEYADKEKVFFTANERGTRYIDLYVVDTRGSGFKIITEEKGFHSVTMSEYGRYYFDKYSNSSTITSVRLYDAEGNKIRDLSTPDFTLPDNYGFGKVEFFTFKTSDGVDLNAAMIKPRNFDENKKYPVLFDVYGGPESGPTKDKWEGFSSAWQQLLVKHGYIIFMVDNRGISGRGKKFEHIVYKRLGEVEVNDMIEAAKYLSSLKYIDASRLGIWGWSYGGYMAALTITKAADYFKTAVAVAPVIHWKYYDSIYTERFMQTPELNPEGYENSSVLNYTQNLKGNLLIIHGTGDDNVHFQNSVKLVEKLISENKQFRTMFYPEKNHGISGGNSRRQLYKMMTDFIIENL